jgi:hypothetical protein
MSATAIAIIIAGLSLVLTFFNHWQMALWRRQDKNDEWVNKTIREVSNKLDKIANAAEHQYYQLRDQLMDIYSVLEAILPDIQQSHESDILHKCIQLKEVTIVRLRKMELASPSAVLQREALMYFVGSHHGQTEDVVAYVKLLYQCGNIDKNNYSLALRIIGNNSPVAILSG